MEPNRMKIWRSRKRKVEDLIETCSCLYHQAAENEDDDDSCGCVYHTQPDCDIESETGSVCECDIHMQAAEVSDHSEMSSSPTHTAFPLGGIDFTLGTSAADRINGINHYGTMESSISPHPAQSYSSDSEEDFVPNFRSESSCADSDDEKFEESSTTKAFLRPGPDIGSNNSDSDITVYDDEEPLTQRIFLEHGPESEEDSDSSVNSGNDDEQENEEIPEDPSDDPGDSEYSDENQSDNDNNSSDSDPDADLPPGTRILTFENDLLNTPLEMEAQHTTREALAMVLSLADKNNLNYEMIIKILIIIHTILGNSALPVTKKQLWSVLNRHAAGVRKHAYCSRCFRALGFLNLLPNPVVCVCGWTKSKGKVKYFITLNIRAQLERLLTLPGMWEKLQYPQDRVKENPDAIEDILDGEAYIRLRAAENGPGPSDFTYNFNLDGFKISDSSKTEAWPIFLKINELRPNLRQKHVVLAGLWVDRDYVHFNLFMKTFVKQANKLSTTGVTHQRDGEEVVSRFFPCCCVADSKGRAGIMRMSTHNGNFGCTFCEHVGVKLEGSMKYPTPGTVVNRIRQHRGQEYMEEIVIPPAELRTDQSIRNLMALERRTRGVIGPAQVMLLNHFDLGIGCSTDDLHPIYKGVTEFHTELLLDGVPEVYFVGINERAVINQRLQGILTPTHISRKPRAIDLRHMWKASEWRNWLLFYAIPCLRGIIPDRYVRHFGLLSKAVFLLSRDLITEESLQEADRTLNEYVNGFQALYGPSNMRFSVHMLTHLVQCVRNWGPLWAHSTFPFESWNHIMGKKMSSPRGAIDQMVMRYLLHFLIASIPSSDQISDNVKEVIDLQIIGSKMKNIVVVDNAYFFGEVIERDATQMELAMLEENGLRNYHNVIEYTQVKLKGMECRSVRYRHDMQSYNCFIYTRDDYFASVDSIVIVSDGYNQVGGVFLTLYEVGDAILGVDHLVPIVNADERAFEIISNIKNLAIKGRIRDTSFITPMHNQCEID
ncbi:RNA polymerase-associated protein CTR9-like protein [Frankliniella fusca]|uniref:RNA polymerase-associated protein CTR9-like protein n=1 Tax=Frankliniella fusca TaxID=407009 RepID=A0AAE1HWQ6_9NEOP|nr:RNA polymerase-associated protein CTR9-like protein [Frankliniella fusca]